MRKLSSVILLTLLLVLSVAAVGWAEPSSLVVVRAADNSLWKATCTGTTCSGFTSFPGMFGSQPTVMWDESLGQFVVWGRAADNGIWRSTFTRTGVFNNDWVKIPGATPSPVAAAGGGATNNFRADNGFNAKISFAAGTPKTLKTFSVIAPYDGYYLVRATGEINTAVGDQVCLQLDTTGTFSFGDDNSCSLNPSSTGSMQDIFAIERWFSVTAGNNTFYVVGQGSNASSYAWNTTLSATFFPYSY